MDVMDGNPSVPPGLVGKEDVIFGNIKQIYEFHQRFVFKENAFDVDFMDCFHKLHISGK